MAADPPETLWEDQAVAPPSRATRRGSLPTPIDGEIDDGLVLWAESPEEARSFLAKAGASGLTLDVDRIFVAKRSGETRINRYLGGLYYRTTNDSAVDVVDDVVVAPPPVVDLVQWCTCDVMLTRGSNPLLVLEDTAHIVRMNLYQRFPRLARAASLGVPSLVLQGTRGLDFRLRGDRWGLYRYLQAFEATARVHPLTPAVPFWYLPTAEAEAEAHRRLFSHIDAILRADTAQVDAGRDQIVRDIRAHLAMPGAVARDIHSIDHAGDQVIVKVGANPDRKSWREKGSGQMDPYVGLILAAKYIYCYDSAGAKYRDLVVEFTHLPPGFWWFANPETTALYKRLPIEFADEVRFLGRDPS